MACIASAKSAKPGRLVSRVSHLMVILRPMRTLSAPTKVDIDARIAGVAARQCNALSLAQALALGASASTVKRRVRSGRWGHPYPGVYTIAGSPPSWKQDLWCAVLAVGPRSVVTHASALHLHGVHLLPWRPLTLTVPHGGHARLKGIFVHQIDDLRPHHVTLDAGLRVSRPERVVVELAATLRQRRLGDVADEVVSAQLSTYARIGACLQEVARAGKPGVARLAEVLDLRGDGHVPPQSELERALFAALTTAGLPAPRRQFPLPGRGAITGLVDAAYIEAHVIIEADGRRWHNRIRDLKRDRIRDTEAARVGWLTLRFMYEQIIHEPHEVCAAVRDVLAVRGQSPDRPVKVPDWPANVRS
jgi:very-short-patch-repair endonuclease